MEIGWNAFCDCSVLTEVELPDNLKSIQSAAFFGTALKVITLPDNVTDFSRSIVPIPIIESSEPPFESIVRFVDKNVIIRVHQGSATHKTLDNYDRTVDEVIGRYGSVCGTGVFVNGVEGKLYLEDYRIRYQIVD